MQTPVTVGHAIGAKKNAAKRNVRRELQTSVVCETERVVQSPSERRQGRRQEVGVGSRHVDRALSRNAEKPIAVPTILNLVPHGQIQT